jgi:hypothetical protein
MFIFSQKFKMAEKFNLADFLTKIHDFLVAEPFNEMFQFLDLLYF